MKTKIMNAIPGFKRSGGRKLWLGLAAGLFTTIFILVFAFRGFGVMAEENADHSTTQSIDLKKAVIGNGLELGAENEILKLYFDNDKGGIIIEDKETGKMFYTNPTSALEDPKASDLIKQQLSSQVRLTYYVNSKKAEEEMNSYTHALLLDQLSWGQIENGIQVVMTIGREEQRLLLPQQISRENFEQLLDKMSSDREKRQMNAFYILYTLEGADDSKKTELLNKYPVLEQTDIYVFKTSATERDKRMLEGYIKKTGYTFEMLETEHEFTGYDASESVFPSFKLVINYTLEDGSLNVDIDTSSIVYDKNHFLLTNISVLNYFGAGIAGEDGYVFLPDGSGTIIGFNNTGTKNTFLTKGKTYGIDGAELWTDRGSFKQEFRFPVFGVKTADTAILGIIRGGDAISEINCEMGNINHSYNTSYANFVISRSDKYIEPGAFEQAPWILYDKIGYSGNIELRYYFLIGEDAGYVGMAKAYRDYLAEEKSIELISVDKQAQVPFFVDTIGSTQMPVKKLGVPIMSDVAVTSFENAYSMIEEFNDMGIGNIKFRYKAWYNGGYYYTAASKLNVVNALGGKKGLSELNTKASQLGAAVFPDVDFLYACYDDIFDGFSSSKDSVRLLFQRMGFYPELYLAELSYGGRYWCINPNSVVRFYNNFMKTYDKLGLTNISLSTTGKGINSNYKNGEYVNRQTSKEIVVDLLKDAATKYEEIIVDYGNAYALESADYVLNLPGYDSSFLIADRSVPFAQIALHGYMHYAANPINLSSTVEKEVLKYIEYGQSPYFLLDYADSSILKQAFIYDEIYSVNFTDWKEKAAEIYYEINEALADVQDSPITNHEQIADEVFITEYENGKQIAVNYSKQSFDIQGINVAPMDYAVIKRAGGN